MAPGRVNNPGSPISPYQRLPRRVGAKGAKEKWKRERKHNRVHIEQQRVEIEELTRSMMIVETEAGPSANGHEGHGDLQHASVGSGLDSGAKSGNLGSLRPPTIINGNLDDDDVQGSTANEEVSRHGFPAAATTPSETPSEDLEIHQEAETNYPEQCPSQYQSQSDPGDNDDHVFAASHEGQIEQLERFPSLRETQSEPPGPNDHRLPAFHDSTNSEPLHDFHQCWTQSDPAEESNQAPTATDPTELGNDPNQRQPAPPSPKASSLDATTPQESQHPDQPQSQPQSNPSPPIPSHFLPTTNPHDLIHLNVSNWAFWTLRRTLFPSPVLRALVSRPSPILVTHPWEPQRHAQSYFVDSCTLYFSDILKHLQSPGQSYLPIFFDPVRGLDVEKYHQLLADAELFGLERLAKWIRGQEWRGVARVEVVVKGWREEQDGGWRGMWREVLGGEEEDGDGDGEGDGGQVLDVRIVRLGACGCKGGAASRMGVKPVDAQQSVSLSQDVSKSSGSSARAESGGAGHHATLPRVPTEESMSPRGSRHGQQGVHPMNQGDVKIAVVKRRVVYNPPRDESEGTRARRDTCGF